MRLPLVCSALLLATLATATSSKPPTKKLVIDRGDLAGVVEITDPATLALSSVFTGQFLDPARGPANPPADLPQYAISFYLPDPHVGAADLLLGRHHLYRAYVVRFAYDPAARAGYVYVPGAGDVWADWNRRTIIRSAEEHRWYHANGAWMRRIAPALAQARRRPAPSCARRANESSGPEPFRPGDSLYASVAEFTTLLGRAGLPVLCAYHTTFDGTLGRPAAGVMTSRGPLAVVFFPSEAEASKVRVSGRVRDGQAVTVLRSAGRSVAVDSLVGTDPATVFVQGRWLVAAFDQDDLARALRDALAR